MPKISPERFAASQARNASEPCFQGLEELVAHGAESVLHAVERVDLEAFQESWLRFAEHVRAAVLVVFVQCAVAHVADIFLGHDGESMRQDK